MKHGASYIELVLKSCMIIIVPVLVQFVYGYLYCSVYQN